MAYKTFCFLFILSIMAPLFSMEQPEENIPAFFTDTAHAECIKIIKKTVIATRAAWHAAQVQDQKIDIILFSEIMKILHAYPELSPDEAFSIINYTIKAYNKPVIHNRVDPIALRAFQIKQREENTIRIDAVYATKEAVLQYLQESAQADI